MNTGLKMRPLAIALALATALPSHAAETEAAPVPLAARTWMNTSLSADKRAELALQAMTQQEKLTWVLGHFGTDFGTKTKKHPAALPSSAGYVAGVPRLGLPALFETDAGRPGHRRHLEPRPGLEGRRHDRCGSARFRLQRDAGRRRQPAARTAQRPQFRIRR
jgi:hypothetical protein